MDVRPHSLLDHPVVSLSLWHMSLGWSTVCTELIDAVLPNWVQDWLELIVSSNVSDWKPTPVMEVQDWLQCFPVCL